MKQVNRPNSFYLKSKNGEIEIVYTTTSITGQPMLSYKHNGKTLTFTGDNEIHNLDSPIGQLVTVTLDHVHDLRSITLTLLIPTIHLDPMGNEIPFISKSIITTHKTSIGGPSLVIGVLQTYQTKELSGTAETIIF
jgi:hypothetical protein